MHFLNSNFPMCGCRKGSFFFIKHTLFRNKRFVLNEMFLFMLIRIGLKVLELKMSASVIMFHIGKFEFKKCIFLNSAVIASTNLSDLFSDLT